MIQWISAIEDSKVDADIAYWNIDGNLSDSAVQSNRGNGQWWLFNAYAQMSGDTVEVTPPFPGENYTLQGVSTLDADRAISRTIVGGADGAAPVELVNVPGAVFGDEVHVTVREIPWTGQLGDSAQPRHVAETDDAGDRREGRRRLRRRIAAAAARVVGIRDRRDARGRRRDHEHGADVLGGQLRGGGRHLHRARATA